jgi:alkanesulfonate monooxygenase SsuD/methylene tetrahydromethanopterin reductase-like flavin-dependent oxidoreductase (luciferase family)
MSEVAAIHGPARPMTFGVGLPTMVPDAHRADIAGWARGAEGAGFATVATIDRLAHPGLGCFEALAAAAAVTERISLTTSVALAPLRPLVVLAKASASVDQISAGRLRLGVGVGSRADDYAAAGAVFARRGATLDSQLRGLPGAWEAELGPDRGQPPILIGGNNPATGRRVADHGMGWIAASNDPAAFSATAPAIIRAWEGTGRDGLPELLALSYFALGPQAEQLVDGFLAPYYSYAPFLSTMRAGTPTTAEGIQRLATDLAGAGCTQLLLFPCSADPAQLAALSDVMAAASDGGVRAGISP